MVILLKYLGLLLLKLLEFLVDFVFFLNELHYFGHFGFIQNFMHSRITEITKDEWECVEKDDVDIAVAQSLSAGQCFFEFLLDVNVDLI